MKAIKLKQILIPGLLFFSQQTFAQLPAIDSLKIIPETPVAGDEIKLICYATFPSGGCDLMDHSIIIQGNQITVTLEYMPGAATYICHAVDTISLGNLEPDNYVLRANVTIQPQDEIVDSDTIAFPVNTALNTYNNGKIPGLALYPNPFNDEIQIETNTLIEKIEISSVSRLQIFLTKDGLNPGNIISVSDLENGVYILVLTDNQGNKHTERIIKN